MASRDLDSRISSREVAAVNEWLRTDEPLHVMRDHPGHKASIYGTIISFIYIAKLLFDTIPLPWWPYFSWDVGNGLGQEECSIKVATYLETNPEKGEICQSWQSRKICRGSTKPIKVSSISNKAFDQLCS